MKMGLLKFLANIRGRENIGNKNIEELTEVDSVANVSPGQESITSEHCTKQNFRPI